MSAGSALCKEFTDHLDSRQVGYEFDVTPPMHPGDSPARNDSCVILKRCGKKYGMAVRVVFGEDETDPYTVCLAGPCMDGTTFYVHSESDFYGAQQELRNANDWIQGLRYNIDFGSGGISFRMPVRVSPGTVGPRCLDAIARSVSVTEALIDSLRGDYKIDMFYGNDAEW